MGKFWNEQAALEITRIFENIFLILYYKKRELNVQFKLFLHHILANQVGQLLLQLSE
jgi:hypothetical protein